MEMPGVGACFYRGPGFQGDYFCMTPNESYDALPPGFNDNISSIRIFGGADVVAFNDPAFGGIRIHLRNDVPDLATSRYAGAAPDGLACCAAIPPSVSRYCTSTPSPGVTYAA